MRTSASPGALLDKIPADAGNIVIAKSDQLQAAQTAVKAIKWMGLLLFVVVVALYALAVFLAKGARRRTLRNVGWSIFVGRPLHRRDPTAHRQLRALDAERPDASSRR